MLKTTLICLIIHSPRDYSHIINLVSELLPELKYDNTIKWCIRNTLPEYVPVSLRDQVHATLRDNPDSFLIELRTDV